MKWTRKKPRKGGWYWYRSDYIRIPEVMWVYRGNKGKMMAAWVFGGLAGQPLNPLVGLWSDRPIEKPTYPRKTFLPREDT